MKGNKTARQTTLVNKAFDNINSAVGNQLNEIVSIIEQHGRKEKPVQAKEAKIIAISKSKTRRSFAAAK